MTNDTAFFSDTVGSKDKTLRLYQDHFHDLLNDIGKEQVMADMVAWIDKRIPKRRAGRAISRSTRPLLRTT